MIDIFCLVIHRQTCSFLSVGLLSRDFVDIADAPTFQVHFFHKKLSSWPNTKSFLLTFQFLITKLTLSFDSQTLLGGSGGFMGAMPPGSML